MTEPTLNEKAATLRAYILADTLQRAARWACFVAIVCGLIAPLVWRALRDAGLACAAAVALLTLALAWHVKPQGRSARARAREIERRYGPPV